MVSEGGARSIPFACPVHKLLLDFNLRCPECPGSYPQVGGIPILINNRNSVFAIEDYLGDEQNYSGASGYAGSLDNRSGLRQLYRRIMHRLMETEPRRREFRVDDAIQRVREENPLARILVIGSGDSHFGPDVVHTDVAFGRHVSCIADAHDLPFEAATFDACVACAVLEHVADPYRCVEEIERVLKPNGWVYAETPFMQPVHMGAYDFTRFTFVGHRRLFRRFDEVASGIAGGPGASVAQIIRSALCGLATGRSKKFLRLAGVLLTLPIRALDGFAARRPDAYDTASGFYFFGRRRAEPLPDREILAFYRGQ